MLNQAITSLIVGEALSVVTFIPALIWQYRSYGAFQPGRTLWTVVSYVYVTALITYTLFPLPDMSGDYCATHPRVVVFDPTLYFREMTERLAGLPLGQALVSWDVLQMVFNVALFVPLGVLLSDFLVIGFWRGICIGLGVSLLIEATQFTANWGLMECAYRIADVNDLITNTTGTAVGYLIALLMPRFVARPTYLRKRRNLARPITRARRWTGMLLDVVIWWASWLTAATLFVIVFSFLVAGQPEPTYAQTQILAWSFQVISVLVGLGLVIVPALSANGASLGQRIVFLRPQAPRRWRLLARALVVQGIGVTVVIAPLSWLLPILVWLLAAVFSVVWSRRGLSCVLTGCTLVDARAVPAAEPQPGMARSTG